MFECVVNISEGRDPARIAAFEHAAGGSLRDRHSDPAHHRSVLTLINPPDALARDVRALVRCAVTTLDLREHQGVHPRFGVVDVVPFVALAEDQRPDARRLRDATAQWMAQELAIPVFLYGPLAEGLDRTLPEVRRRAFRDLAPDAGPASPTARTGASAVGERPVLVAWNLWLRGVSPATARSMARAVRADSVRSLAFDLDGAVQVSCNLLDVHAARPSTVYDRVEELLPRGGSIERAELVGLAPRRLLDLEDQRRWDQLGLSADATIEARLGR